MVADPKPAKRFVASGDEWLRLRFLKLTSCRVCGDSRVRKLSLHHLVPRSLGGDDVEDNLVALCGSGTTGCHGRVEARDPVTLRRLRKALTSSEIRYATEKKSKGWLDRYLPP